MFQQLKDIRRSLSQLERTLQALLVETRSVVAAGAQARVPGEAGWAWAGASPKPTEPPPAAVPPPRPATGPYAHRGAFNDPRGWQGPAYDAPRLPPPPPPVDPRKMVVSMIEEMRACAVHFHNCSRLLLTIADLVEVKLNDRRR